MPYEIIPVTPYQQNCSLLWCAKTRHSTFIDPGGDAERLIAAAERLQLAPQVILLTHGHLDHVGAAAELARHYRIEIIGPQEGDDFWLEGLAQQAQMFGFPSAEPLRPDHWLHDGDQVEVGGLTLEVIHCPGHTPGHIVLFDRVEKTVFVGDVLFRGSIGRSDFPGSNHDTLINCIRSRLFPLGDGISFVPGHGPCGTLGEERRSNPFVGEAAD